MKRYFIKKILFAENIQEVIDIDKTGEILEITLDDDIKVPHDMGYDKKDGQRNEVVSEIRKGSKKNI